MTPPKGKDASRQKILDAAGAAFADLGFAGTSMEEIARRAGLTRMTVYNLFASKEEIALSIVARIDAQFAPIYRQQLDSGRDALELIQEALLESARWCLANASLAAVVLSSHMGMRSYAPPADRPSFHGYIRDLVALGQRQGRFRTDVEANIVALILLGSYTMTMLSALAGGPFEEIWVANLPRLLVEGIAAKNS
jgi:AcrR family transcriptional regulator